ncbi:hypothetical protein OSTOST_16629, partial [Ostertagia ostertagi]
MVRPFMVIVETRLLFSVVCVLVMDDSSSPPDPGAAPDVQRSRDAAVLKNISLSRDAAATKTSCTAAIVKEESAMDTSETAVSGPLTEAASTTVSSSVSGTVTEPTVAQTSTSEATLSATFAEIASRSKWHSAASSSFAASQRKFHSEKELPHKSDEDSVISMTSSMEHLSVTEVAPPTPPQAPASVSSFTPPAKVMRSSSSQRRPAPAAPTQ